MADTGYMGKESLAIIGLAVTLCKASATFMVSNLLKGCTSCKNFAKASFRSVVSK
jgi:hypothetical protein